MVDANPLLANILGALYKMYNSTFKVVPVGMNPAEDERQGG